MDRLDAMSIVVAVHEAGSLSAAARRLGIPLPTASRKLSDLETHLNARLFNRSTRRVTLTDAGHAYVGACKRILEEVGEAERAVSGEFSAPKGDLIVSAPIVFGRLHVLPIITEFLQTYTEVKVRLILNDRTVDLPDNHVDLAVRIGDLRDRSLVAVRVGSTRTVVCAGPGYLAERGVPKRPHELQDHQCIVFEGLSSAEVWVFGTGGSEVLVPIHPRLMVNTAEAAIDAAIAGGGLTRVLSYQIEQAIAAGELVRVLQRFEPDAIPVSLIYTSQGRLPLKMRAFFDFAAPRLRARLAGKTP